MLRLYEGQDSITNDSIKAEVELCGSVVEETVSFDEDLDLSTPRLVIVDKANNDIKVLDGIFSSSCIKELCYLNDSDAYNW